MIDIGNLNDPWQVVVSACTTTNMGKTIGGRGSGREGGWGDYDNDCLVVLGDSSSAIPFNAGIQD